MAKKAELPVDIYIYTAGLVLKENNKSSIVWWLTPVILSETQILGIF